MGWGSRLACLLAKLLLNPQASEHSVLSVSCSFLQRILEWVESARQNCWPWLGGLHRLSVAPFVLARGCLSLKVWEL